MKLKRPITDTKELLEIAFPLVSAITAAGASDGDIASVGAALTMLISEIERADGEKAGDAGAGNAERKREVFPDIYEKPKGVTLCARLWEYAEWAKCNEWETPIGLGRDLEAAACLIESVSAKMPWVISIGAILPGGET